MTTRSAWLQITKSEPPSQSSTHQRRTRSRRCVERRRRSWFGRYGVVGDYGSAVIPHVSRYVASVSGKTVDPASASGVDERLLGAPLAHVGRIPGGVLAARPVAVTEHRSRTIRRNVLVLLRQGHGVRSPVVAGVIVAIGERPPLGVRTGHYVVLVAAGRRSNTWNLVTLDIEGGRALHVVAVALLVAVEIGDIAGDQLTLDVVPGAGADPIARIDARLVATLFLGEIGVPSACGGWPAQRLGFVLAYLVGAREPPRLPVPDAFSAMKKLASWGFICGCCCWACANMAADPRRAMTTLETTIVLLTVISPLYVPLYTGPPPYHLPLSAAMRSGSGQKQTFRMPTHAEPIRSVQFPEGLY
jgi:hypothetical protein